MSILIEGMEMPKYFQQAEVGLDADGNGVLLVYPEGGNEPNVYSIVPVPPHGRLIDADAQDAQIEALIERHLHGYTKSTWDFVCELRDILKRNSTIIEAEEGE